MARSAPFWAIQSSNFCAAKVVAPIARALAALGLAAVLSLTAAPVLAKPNAQLVRSVEHRLATIGMRDVDASQLTTQQVGALHLRLQGNFTFGLNRIRAQQDVKVILNWGS